MAVKVERKEKSSIKRVIFEKEEDIGNLRSILQMYPDSSKYVLLSVDNEYLIDWVNSTLEQLEEK